MHCTMKTKTMDDLTITTIYFPLTKKTPYTRAINFIIHPTAGPYIQLNTAKNGGTDTTIHYNQPNIIEQIEQWLTQQNIPHIPLDTQ